MSTSLYAMGTIGAVISMAGDALCLLAALAYLAHLRGIAAALVALGVVVWGLSGLVWFWMIVATDGSFARPAMAWGISGAVCSLAMCVVRGEKMGAVDWACLVVVVGAGVVKGVWGGR